MTGESKNKWTVLFSGKARKQKTKLPTSIIASLALLESELKLVGPVVSHWPHYGKIAGKKNMHHCHLNKGKPCYVAVWKVIDDIVDVLEMRYVGTHENANYRRID